MVARALSGFGGACYIIPELMVADQLRHRQMHAALPRRDDKAAEQRRAAGLRIGRDRRRLKVHGLGHARHHLNRVREHCPSKLVYHAGWSIELVWQNGASRGSSATRRSERRPGRHRVGGKHIAAPALGLDQVLTLGAAEPRQLFAQPGNHRTDRAIGIAAARSFGALAASAIAAAGHTMPGVSARCCSTRVSIADNATSVSSGPISRLSRGRST